MMGFCFFKTEATFRKKKNLKRILQPNVAVEPQHLNKNFLNYDKC